MHLYIKLKIDPTVSHAHIPNSLSRHRNEENLNVNACNVRHSFVCEASSNKTACITALSLQDKRFSKIN